MHETHETHAIKVPDLIQGTLTPDDGSIVDHDPKVDVYARYSPARKRVIAAIMGLGILTVCKSAHMPNPLQDYILDIYVCSPRR
jgi:hypothetical protein